MAKAKTAPAKPAKKPIHKSKQRLQYMEAQLRRNRTRQQVIEDCVKKFGGKESTYRTIIYFVFPGKELEDGTPINMTRRPRGSVNGTKPVTSAKTPAKRKPKATAKKPSANGRKPAATKRTAKPAAKKKAPAAKPKAPAKAAAKKPAAKKKAPATRKKKAAAPVASEPTTTDEFEF